VLAGFVVSLTLPAEASRNSSGTHSLPSGNPVVSGTTISSTMFNNTMSDISTEITNSLDRSGRGAMTAALQCYAGSVSAPGLTFSSDTDTGLYRNAANDVRMAAGGVYAQSWTASEVRTPQKFVGNDGGVFTHGATNGDALTVTGAGTGVGLYATGGGTNAAGISAVGGATNGPGILAAGTGSGRGGTFSSTSGDGLMSTGGGTSVGGVFTGGSSGGVGVWASNGIAATGATRRDALSLRNGDLDFSAVTAPNATTNIANRLTIGNLPKVWARINTDGLGGVTLAEGFNVDAVSISSGNLLVEVGSSFNADTYACVVSGGASAGVSAAFIYRVSGRSVADLTIQRWDTGATASDSFATTPADQVSVICFGAQ
jgi:hypothetical protein